MACPFFVPGEPLPPEPGPHLPRLPLGAAYSGACCAHPGDPHTPGETRLREFCNCGYARGRCERFPASEETADAVRFSVASDAENCLRVVFIFEKDHAPASHGLLEFALAAGSFAPSPGEPLAAQARAFVKSYLRLRGGSAAAGAV
jgi:hypothetical protein